MGNIEVKRLRLAWALGEDDNRKMVTQAERCQFREMRKRPALDTFMIPRKGRTQTMVMIEIYEGQYTRDGVNHRKNRYNLKTKTIIVRNL